MALPSGKWVVVFLVMYSVVVGTTIVEARCNPSGPPPPCTSAQMFTTGSKIENCFNSLPEKTLETGADVIEYATECVNQMALRNCIEPSRGAFTNFVGYFLHVLRKFGVERITYIKPTNQVEDDKECFNILDYRKWAVCHGQFYRFAVDTWHRRFPYSGDMASCFKNTSCKCIENCAMSLLQRLAELIPKVVQYDPHLACSDPIVTSSSHPKGSVKSPDCQCSCDGKTYRNVPAKYVRFKRSISHIPKTHNIIPGLLNKNNTKWTLHDIDNNIGDVDKYTNEEDFDDS